ncbi:elongation factor G [Kineosphaera limosa]|uniref:Elongation factor G n=1 Tax=Kineosphaera limosa NBRC 100340 TaxID=1184609 RepID=K6X7P0_9MICO|nr:elongation factor G-like protein EF-G2 [Kineosphaera limosa]NYD98881.1 elongation factor G [Kineosphaera limosa]GAB94794.1 elongation factor G [Kineosphaera limosa NBRC 100340]
MARASSAQTPTPTDTDHIRNVVLVGPSGSGKTRLFDHLVSRTTPGYRPPNRDDQRTTGLEVAALECGDVVLNLIDAPGYPDFVGELRAGLRAGDAALFVISATDGVDAATEALWHECAAVNQPRAVVVTKLDAPRADYAGTLAATQAAFGDGVLPLGIPVVRQSRLEEIVDLVLGEVHDYSGGQRAVRATGPEHIPVFDEYHGPLLEGIITEAEDDTLLERYLGGEEVGFEIVEAALLTAVARGSFHPVVPLSVDTGAGIDVIMHLVEAAFPPPPMRPMPTVFTVAGAAGPQLVGDPGGPLVAEVVRTTNDPYAGHVALLRVFSGTLTADTVVHVSGHLGSFVGHEVEGHEDHDEQVRVGPLSSPLGSELRPKDAAIAGDLAVVAKLGAAQTSDTVSDKDDPLVIEPWQMPQALLPVAIQPATRADLDKLPGALQRIAGADPSLRVEHNGETGQTVLWTMGPTHLDLVMARLKESFNVDVAPEDLRIPLRETFVGRHTAQGRHVKQSGGHGQYAVCQITVEPLERGAGFEFVDKVVGGAVPRQFIPSVEKGVRAQLEKGTISNYPMVDVRVTLHDGKAHSVDSSDAAFQTAGALALKEAAATNGAITLLEPIDVLEVKVADDHVGAVMTDMQTRRGRIQGSEPANQAGYSVVRAEVPQLELSRYAIDLRSLSHGSGTFTRTFSGYEQMPHRLVEEHLVAG